MITVKNCFCCWLLVFSFLFHIEAKAQISASPTEGCAPLVGVQFDSPDGGVNVQWDFGDNTSANTVNPTHTYTMPGVYTVDYSATVGGNQVNETLTVTVNGNPSANFNSSLPVSGCTGLNVSFTDISTGGGGSNITNWSWDFGDGVTDNTNNSTPNHTYTLPGAFDVVLTVTDANGCDSTIVRENYVQISNPPNAVLTSTPFNAFSCEPPLTVTFSGVASSSNSPFSNTLTYNWDFGNGQTSSLSNPPAQTYTESGSFVVTLTVTDDVGCSSTNTQTVQISSPTASFTIADTDSTIICEQATFINSSTPGIYTWDFGDGSPSVVTGNIFVDHEFPGPGMYDVSLNVDAGACSNDTTITITVEEVNADFTFDPIFACENPVEVQYTDNSTNAAAWLWTFGDGSTSEEQNPLHVYDFRSADPYILYDEMPVIASLEVTSPNGCISTFTSSDFINWLPTARFFPDVSEGCVPLTVNFNDLSTASGDIVNWTYLWGDGNMETFTDGEDISYTFTEAGDYDVFLVIENDLGCMDTSYLQPIRVGNLPSPEFVLDSMVFCPLDTIFMSDITPEGDSLDTWHFDTSDGAVWHCLADSEPAFIINNDIGLQDLTLVGGHNGCYDSLTVADAFEVLGAIGKISHACDCNEPMFYEFTGDIRGANLWDWRYGDGDSLVTSTDTAPAHLYEESGDYWVTLTVWDTLSTCAPFTDSLLIKVRNLTAEFTVQDTIVCVGEPIGFDASMSMDVNDTCKQGYQWYFDDGQAPFRVEDSVYTYMFNGSVEHDVRLVTKDVNGCRDTFSMRMYAYLVQASFVTDTLMGCADPGFTVNFDDTSTGDTTLVSWAWDFGDNTTGEGEEVDHEFGLSETGTFAVNLLVEDAVGCPGFASAIVEPFVPNAAFSAINRLICVGETVSFAPENPFHSVYEWDFGDGSMISTEQNPTHTFDQPGLFTISLAITDTNGCRHSSERVEYIDVQAFPEADFISESDSLENKCYPLLAGFTDNTDGMGSLYTISWDFDNGSPTVPNPSVSTIYNQPGEYNVTLTTTSPYNCTDEVTKTLIVEGPIADFSLDPSPICRGETVLFNITEQDDVAFWSWDFGDGFVENGGDPVSHTYDINPISGETLVSLTYWSPDSVCEASTIKTLEFLPIRADFDRNNEAFPIDTSHCIGIADVFTNTSSGADVSVWDFGDGTTFEGTNPPDKVYAATGTYTITLAITNNETGCADEISKDIIVSDLAIISGIDGGACEPNEPIQLGVTAIGGTMYQWSPATGLDNPNIAAPIATVEETTQYIVTVTDIGGCVASDSVTAAIILEPSQDLLDSLTIDTTLIIGESIVLNANIGEGLNYDWFPDTDLSCSDCPAPVSFPFDDRNYTVLITDDNDCLDNIQINYNINLIFQTSIDVPTAFTPNGDDINDEIFVRGWGLIELVEFKIFNRYGQLLYDSQELDKGWDGSYQGEIQNMDTYTYSAIARDYTGTLQTKSGNFTLIR